MLVALCAVNTAVADPTYTIKQNGQADDTGTFNALNEFMDVLNAHNVGTAENRVTATITGATITTTGRDGGFFLLASDSFTYTDIVFDHCTFDIDNWVELLFDESKHPGNMIKFFNCRFREGRGSVYGIGRTAHAGGVHNYDFVFKECEMSGIGGGGTCFGDVTIEDCTISNNINMNCGYISEDHGINNTNNSFGQPATLTIKNTTFTNHENGSIGVYANLFPKCVYQAKTGETEFLYAYDGNGYYSQMDPFIYNLLSATGSCTFTQNGAQTAFYVINSMQVKYYGNGGTGSVVDANAYIPGGETTILNNGFTYAGHAFTGWNTKADGTGTSYAPGEKASLEFGENLELYAQWVEALRYAIKVKCAGLNSNESALFAIKCDDVLENVINITGGGVSARMLTNSKIVSSGTCTVIPYGNWSWTYDVVLSNQSSELSDKGVIEVYEFTATKKESITTENGESLKINKLRK